MLFYQERSIRDETESFPRSCITQNFTGRSSQTHHCKQIDQELTFTVSVTQQILTLPTLCISGSCIEKKINLHFFFILAKIVNHFQSLTMLIKKVQLQLFDMVQSTPLEILTSCFKETISLLKPTFLCKIFRRIAVSLNGTLIHSFSEPP